MKEWARARIEQGCGRCGGRIERGEPLLLIRLHGGLLVKVRCQGCAGEPVPATLPDLSVPVGITSVLKASTIRRRPLFASTSELVIDWKTRQSREPGEDDR